MSKIKRFSLLLMSVLGCLTMLPAFTGWVTPVYGQDFVRVIPSFGNGPYEVIVFADYFCPPCKRIDTKAEGLFNELVATGKVKLTFIDVPFSPATPVFAKYYLYAANADAGIKNMLHTRRVLFEAAQVRRVTSEKELVAYLGEMKINWKAMNEKSVFPLMSAAIKEHKIDNTPTCVIRYSASDVKRYVGDLEIWDGLTKLKSHLSVPKKKVRKK